MKDTNKNNTLAEMIMLSNTSRNLRLLDYTTRIVCKYYNIEPDEMKSKTRKREICFPRQVAMYLLKKHTNLSLASIGEYFKPWSQSIPHRSIAIYMLESYVI